MQLGAQAVGVNLLPSPDGKADTIDALVAQLEVFAKSPGVIPTGQAGQDYFTKRALALVKSFGYTTVNEGKMMGPQAKDIESLATCDISRRCSRCTPSTGATGTERSSAPRRRRKSRRCVRSSMPA